MDKKKSFILYYDQQDIFELLSNEEAGELIKTIYKVVQNQETDLTFNGRKHMQMALVPILKTLERNKEKYEETCERNRKNAQKRWQDEKCDRIQTHTNYADSDNDNESENESESESDSYSYSDNDSDSGISPPIKEDIYREAFNKIFDIYPYKEHKDICYDKYCELIKGKLLNGKIHTFTSIEIEIYIQKYIEFLKEQGYYSQEKAPLLEDILDTKILYFVEYLDKGSDEIGTDFTTQV